MDIKPNPGCTSKLCRSRQGDYLKKYNSAEAIAARQAAERKAREESQPASHEENEWKIETIPEDDREEAAGEAGETFYKQKLTEGLQFELPVSFIESNLSLEDCLNQILYYPHKLSCRHIKGISGGQNSCLLSPCFQSALNMLSNFLYFWVGG